MNTLHTLYRFYNAEGHLLYVGITSNPPARFSQHRQQKQWWSDVATIQLEQFADRDQLAAAEIKAIRQEKPLHNITHAKFRPSKTRHPCWKCQRELAKHDAPDDPPAICQRCSAYNGKYDSYPRGIKHGNVYALGLNDGTCPVGMVTYGADYTEDIDIFGINKYSWMQQRFTGEEEWINVNDIVEHAVAIPNRHVPAGEYEYWLVDMDDLGDFQTSYIERYEAAVAK